MNSISFLDQEIGDENSCFIIAEAGVNHNGNLDLALELVDVAAESGANAIKFQTFITEEVISMNAPKADYQKVDPGENVSQLEMVKGLELDFIEFEKIKEHCSKKDIIFLSTPFDYKSVDFLDRLDVPIFKIGSGEITHWPLLKYTATKNKPIILSTGMSNLSDIEGAINIIKKTGNNDIVLLHCVSSYPASKSEINLNAMGTLSKAFNLPVGFSDHTLGVEIPIAAVTLGAVVIEKHFTLNKCFEGPDHSSSLDPNELKRMVQNIRNVEVALGHGRKVPTESETKLAKVARRSLVAAKNISKGTVMTKNLIKIKRPGTGYPPSMLSHILGLEVKKDIPVDSVLNKEMFSR